MQTTMAAATVAMAAVAGSSSRRCTCGRRSRCCRRRRWPSRHSHATTCLFSVVTGGFDDPYRGYHDACFLTYMTTYLHIQNEDIYNKPADDIREIVNNDINQQQPQR